MTPTEHMKHRISAALFVSLVSTMPSIVWTKDVRIERVRYPVIETAYWVRSMPGSSQIEWIDDARVIFAGYEHGTDKAPKPGIYIFSVSTSTGTRYADGTLRCFGRGRIRYVTQREDGRQIALSGPLGAEKESMLKVSPNLLENRFSCSFYDRTQVPEAAGVPARMLLEEHGYLELTFQILKTWPQPVRYLRADGVAVVLPLLQRDMAHPQIAWYPHRSAYLLYDWTPSEILDEHDPSRPRRVGVPKKVYLLMPEGALTSMEVPYNNWHRGFGRFYLTKPGLVMLSRGHANRNPLHQELFLIRPDRWHLVMTGGEAISAAVSPDGCRLAIGMAKMPRAKERPLLHIVDFCPQGRQQ